MDVGPALDSLTKLSQAADLTSATIRRGQEATNNTFAEAARQATAYSDILARQQGEVRAAAAAVASARDELKRLNDQQKELITAQAKLNSTTAEYQRIGRELDKNRKSIAEVKAAINESTQAVRDERAAVEQVRESRRLETNAARETAAAAKDVTAAAKQEAAAQKEAAAAATQTGAAGGGLAGVLGKIGGVLGGLAVLSFAKRIGGEVVEVTSDFERMSAVLTTIFDGDEGKAQRVFAQLRQFTLKNPFEVREVTEGYVRLRNVGINPSIQQLQQLADLAAASGKSFDTVTNSLLGATTGRFAQLKQFGITARQQGDEVALTFRGVTTVVNKSQEAIASYILGLGQLNGVAGATDRIMETTGGRITNLKDNFTELFNTIGEGTGGPINAFIRGLGLITKGVNDFFKSDKQRLAEATAGPAQAYADSLDQQFTLAAERAKKNGKAVYYAVYQVAQQQEKELRQQLAEAEKRVADLPDPNKNYAAYAAKYNDISGTGTDGAARARAKADALDAKAYVEYVQAGLKALKERAQVAIKGGADEADILGLVAKQRAKIADIIERQGKAQREKAGNGKDYLLGAGGLDEQLVAANKELDRLLGKTEALKKARQYSYEAQLRALLNERRMLDELAGKASEKLADDAAGRARVAFENSLRQVDIVRDKLVQRELDLRKAAARVGGGAVARLGEKADGVIDGTQDKALAQLRIAALDEYYKSLYAITAAREQRLFDLRADSDQKEVEAVDRKYDALIKRTTDNIERQAIEEARQREQLALKAQQEQRRIEATATLGRANASTVGDTFGEGTGISVIEAKRAEQQALIDIERKAAEDSLNNTLNRTGKEAEIERAALRAQLARLHQQQVELNKVKSQTPAEDIFFKAIFGEQDSDENRQKLKQIVGEFASAYEATTRAAIQAADQKIAAYDRDISELSASLAAQVQLNQAGSASNIKGILDQINEEKQARSAALREKKEAQRQEALINEAQQASALLTAAANLILGWSELPLVGQVLGALSVAAMLATFLSTRATVSSATAGGFFVGGYTGDGDERQTSTAVGPRPYEYHRREFVMPHDLTDKYRFPLFEPLHQGKPIDWSAPELQALLPDLGLPGQMAADKRAYVEHNLRISMGGMESKLDRLHDRLSAIEGSNDRMADRPDLLRLSDRSYLERNENGGYTIKNV